MKLKYFLGLLFSLSVVWFAASALLYLLVGEQMLDTYLRSQHVYRVSPELPPWLIIAYVLLSEILIIRFIIKKLK